MRSLKVFVLVLSIGLGAGLPAHAGGWWSGIGFDNQPVGIGESIDLRVSDIMFDTIAEAERARTRTFYAYLVQEFDEGALEEAMTRANPGDWWTPLTRPVRVGRVELFGWDANLAKARVSLDIPRIETGPYSLMLCDEGCDAPLGDLIPSRVEVSADALAARTMRRLRRSEASLRLALRRVGNDLRRTRATLERELAEDAERAGRIEALEARLVEVPEPEGPPWVVYAGWFFAGGAAVALLKRRRPAETETFAVHVPDDARALTRAP